MHHDLLLGLPKPIRDALARLANEQRVVELIAQLEEYLRLLDPEAEVPELPEYDPDRPPNVDWDEGVDQFHTWTKDDLWAFLGVDHLPFFNKRLDTLHGRHFWEDEALASQINDSGSPLDPRWHQLVGIVKMLTNCFQRRPVLLMDDVGIGKTLQVIGLVAVLAYYRQHFAQHARFPGKIGESSLDLHSFSSSHLLAGQEGLTWPGDSVDGNIPDRPFIIVVPAPLISQFGDECRRYLEPQSFDLLSYTGTLAKRPAWWSTVFDACHHSLSRRIVIATTSVQYSLTRSIPFICL
jgi:SNF2 family DNA or RNA helicase